ncbi:hypothetical protein QN397_25690 [Variovorax sp. RTB1]|uniref:hypothetical protein n=1 Tax=Variovorax sp. RTB1 TaxID=3048631 RepID=UPI002B225B09|nr:hypothetical protein [Variovorax sp. RTB1]MEB0114675.1 hypothetical protein [Variovorax sp. RTB1]
MLRAKVLIFDANQTLADLAPSSTSISMSTPPDHSCGCARAVHRFMAQGMAPVGSVAIGERG